MGLLNEGARGKKTYASIVNGNFAIRMPEGEGVKREFEVKGEKKIVWEKIYKTIDGQIDSVNIKEDGKFGDQLEINLSNSGDSVTVTMGLSTREAKAFMSMLPNIDIRSFITLEPYNYERKGDKKHMIGMSVSQNGEKIKFFYDKTNGLPFVGDEKMEKDDFKLLMKQQEIWLKKATKKFIEEKWGRAVENPPKDQAKETEHINVDDLPF